MHAQGNQFLAKIRGLAVLSAPEATELQSAVNDGPWPDSVKNMLMNEIGMRMLAPNANTNRKQQRCNNLEHWVTQSLCDKFETPTSDPVGMHSCTMGEFMHKLGFTTASEKTLGRAAVIVSFHALGNNNPTDLSLRTVKDKIQEHIKYLERRSKYPHQHLVAYPLSPDGLPAELREYAYGEDEPVSSAHAAEIDKLCTTRTFVRGSSCSVKQEKRMAEQPHTSGSSLMPFGSGGGCSAGALMPHMPMQGNAFQQFQMFQFQQFQQMQNRMNPRGQPRGRDQHDDGDGLNLQFCTPPQNGRGGGLAVDSPFDGGAGGGGYRRCNTVGGGRLGLPAPDEDAAVADGGHADQGQGDVLGDLKRDMAALGAGAKVTPKAKGRPKADKKVKASKKVKLLSAAAKAAAKRASARDDDESDGDGDDSEDDASGASHEVDDDSDDGPPAKRRPAAALKRPAAKACAVSAKKYKDGKPLRPTGGRNAGPQTVFYRNSKITVSFPKAAYRVFPDLSVSNPPDKQIRWSQYATLDKAWAAALAECRD